MKPKWTEAPMEAVVRALKDIKANPSAFTAQMSEQNVLLRTVPLQNGATLMVSDSNLLGVSGRLVVWMIEKEVARLRGIHRGPPQLNSPYSLFLFQDSASFIGAWFADEKVALEIEASVIKWSGGKKELAP